MSASDKLDRITVTSPCLSDWNEMIGNDQIRFCKHCNLDVHNISEMTRREAARLVARSNGRLCVRYYRTSSGDLISQPPPRTLHQINRRTSRIAASAFGAALTMSTAMVGTSTATTSQVDHKNFQTESWNRWDLGGTVVGTILDVNGAVIPGASVSIAHAENKLSLYSSTDDTGEFKFTGLPQGLYHIRTAASGFVPDEASIFVQENEVRINRTLTVEGPVAEVDVQSEPPEVVTVGVMAQVAPIDPFIKAAQEDNLEELESLIADRDVNLRDKRSGTTALEHAVENGNREMVQLLLSKGADVNAQNRRRRTVLMMVDEDATSDLVWDLINAGAKLELKDDNGDTPLTEAASYQNLEVLKTLLDAGARMDARNDRGQTALILAASNGHVNNVRYLILAGSNLSDCDDEGKNALSHAIENNHSAVIRFLRARGAFESVAEKTEE